MQRQLVKSILCTIGPSSWDAATLKRLEDLGVGLFRINLSHTRYEDLPSVIERISKASSVPICLDSEGAQIRTTRFKEKQVYLEENSIVDIPKAPVEGDAKQFNFHPANIVDQLQVGDLLTIDFHAVLAQVINQTSQGIRIRLLTGGYVGQNKAVSVDRELQMPPLTEKDLKAISLMPRYGIKHVALSFANNASDVKEMRRQVGPDVTIIAKIESTSGVKNLEAISQEADSLLIDRGDLSRQVPIEQIPRVQKNIIQRAKILNKKIYVATNLLESMIQSPGPTRAEVNDIFNTLADGADGLVLAAETAIGQHPIACCMMVAKVIDQYALHMKGASIDEALKNRESLLLPPAHGGQLIQQDVLPLDKHGQACPAMVVSRHILMDAQHLAQGVFSPLKGFMNAATLDSVLSDYRLLDGTAWSMPILMPLPKDQEAQVKAGQTWRLLSHAKGETHATMHIEDVFQYDLKRLCQLMYGTDDVTHPGVRYTLSLSGLFASGQVFWHQPLASDFAAYELTPRQTRAIFEYKGWSRVVGFHTRNVVHRAHEFMQLDAMKKYQADGLLIHPVIGPKKAGDFVDRIVLQTYEAAIEAYYPKGKVVLAAFNTYARYAGPREAVFTALCRKNYGCSHFIIGRDHTGVGQFYPPDGAKTLFGQMGDLGITPVFYDGVHYCRLCGDYVSQCEHGQAHAQSISGTQTRDMIQGGEKPPEWLMRPKVADMLMSLKQDRQEIFVS